MRGHQHVEADMPVTELGWLVAAAASMANVFFLLIYITRGKKRRSHLLLWWLLAVLFAIAAFAGLLLPCSSLCLTSQTGTIQVDPGTALYFSVITITHVGYGALYPCTGYGRAVAAMEAVVGFLLLGVVIALVVRGLFPGDKD